MGSIFIIWFCFTENNIEDPRVLGLAMIPGKYIISISIDDLTGMGQGSPYVTWFLFVYTWIVMMHLTNTIIGGNTIFYYSVKFLLSQPESWVFVTNTLLTAQLCPWKHEKAAIVIKLSLASSYSLLDSENVVGLPSNWQPVLELPQLVEL